MTTRRAILKALGMAPATAAAMIPALEASLAGVGVGAASALGNIGVGYGSPQPTAAKAMKLFDFASWLKQVGDNELRNDAREVRTIDADIMSMRLPFNTKIKWQQERNYRRLIENRKSWFDRQVERHGFVEHWS